MSASLYSKPFPGLPVLTGFSRVAVINHTCFQENREPLHSHMCSKKKESWWFGPKDSRNSVELKVASLTPFFALASVSRLAGENWLTRKRYILGSSKKLVEMPIMEKLHGV